jgi:hypothetical protein
VVGNACFLELTSCKIDFICSKICSDIYFLPPTFLLRLSFPPLRSPNSSFVVFVRNGPAPLVFPLSSSSFEVSSSGEKD